MTVSTVVTQHGVMGGKVQFKITQQIIQNVNNAIKQNDQRMQQETWEG